MAMLVKWKVDPEPTGRYRSFERRGWPSADYKDTEEMTAAMIRCEDSYDPSRVKSGKHGELTLYFADYSVNPWTWRSLKKKFRTIKECKDAFEEFMRKYPQYLPEHLRNKRK